MHDINTNNRFFRPVWDFQLFQLPISPLNNLKVSKMSRTPQTGNPYVEPSVGNLYNVSLMAERGQDTIRWWQTDQAVLGGTRRELSAKHLMRA